MLLFRAKCVHDEYPVVMQMFTGEQGTLSSTCIHKLVGWISLDICKTVPSAVCAPRVSTKMP